MAKKKTKLLSFDLGLSPAQLKNTNCSQNNRNETKPISYVFCPIEHANYEYPKRFKKKKKIKNYRSNGYVIGSYNNQHNIVVIPKPKKRPTNLKDKHKQKDGCIYVANIINRKCKKAANNFPFVAIGRNISSRSSPC